MTSASYTVEVHDGCRIVRGAVPVHEMGKLLAMGEEGDVLDTRLAHQIGATRVFGSQEGLAALRAKGLPLSRERIEQIAAAKAAGLSAAAVDWVRAGDRGKSSETIFTHLTGVSLRTPEAYGLPGDPSDFGCCRKLLEAVPELEPELHRLAQLGPAWAALVVRWQEIASLMDTEAPEWREGRGAAPGAYDAIRAIAE